MGDCYNLSGIVPLDSPWSWAAITSTTCIPMDSSGPREEVSRASKVTFCPHSPKQTNKRTNNCSSGCNLLQMLPWQKPQEDTRLTNVPGFQSRRVRPPPAPVELRPLPAREPTPFRDSVTSPEFYRIGVELLIGSLRT